MYYSSGNYEAFARPEKPEGVEHKSAYIIGTGREAQEECNRRNRAGTAYHYFMEAAEVKKEGIEI